MHLRSNKRCKRVYAMLYRVIIQCRKSGMNESKHSAKVTIVVDVICYARKGPLPIHLSIFPVTLNPEWRTFLLRAFVVSDSRYCCHEPDQTQPSNRLKTRKRYILALKKKTQTDEDIGLIDRNDKIILWWWRVKEFVAAIVFFQLWLENRTWSDALVDKV